VTDPFSGKRRYFTDATGKPIIANIDEKSLKNIAESTGGKFFLADDNKTLTAVFDTLSKLKKTEIETRIAITHESLV
jgi:hypothetical protein